MKALEKIFLELASEAVGISHGEVILKLCFRDHHLFRYTLSREKSTIVTIANSDPEGKESVTFAEIEGL